MLEILSLSSSYRPKSLHYRLYVLQEPGAGRIRPEGHPVRATASAILDSGAPNSSTSESSKHTKSPIQTPPEDMGVSPATCSTALPEGRLADRHGV
ncbi:hypothetical protein BU16DRAFT_320932 [Lophium mytilinum]|uniref:Uncharacterized protein n=1 Tax=Lophium mytilinum TaxID=390894 RepID=A0A6A6R0A4_9PEZI|nr:hypothetical protein BU16DRAFT_320932 [Lophium mytilinum]